MKAKHVALLLAVLGLGNGGAQPPSLYDRVAARLAADPKLAEAIGKPAPELRELGWLIGRWKVTARVFATPETPERVDDGESTVEPILGGTWLQLRDTYGGEVQDLGFLTFNAATRRWVSVSIDHTGNAVTSIAEPGERLVFLARDVEVLGERVTLRQTMQKRSAREYRILNEEQLPDGSWVALDEYVYRK